jgi:hypothetical protein
MMPDVNAGASGSADVVGRSRRHVDVCTRRYLETDGFRDDLAMLRDALSARSCASIVVDGVSEVDVGCRGR